MLARTSSSSEDTGNLFGTKKTRVSGNDFPDKVPLFWWAVDIKQKQNKGKEGRKGKKRKRKEKKRNALMTGKEVTPRHFSLFYFPENQGA